MNIHWVFPDDSTWETNVPNVNQLLFALEVVDSVSMGGVTYKTMHKQLVVNEDRCFVSVSLAHPTSLKYPAIERTIHFSE
ncbi:hypothetical protein [Paenibacillus ginsengarvi]|uniref:Uncharacterized protein n=1 Tax=Paenibacillus ginsengarvi TaxID=400777 RepID=A0A3B0BXZ5_9BACL|nr:hypothetical protein [Paenibacillus ginsengarvi]RKN77089.1 hypothetical protein D7M11_24010 [Paenibacillus ginsengarvi]